MRSISNCFILASTSSTADVCWFHTLPAIGEYPGKQIIFNDKPLTATIVVDQESITRCQAAFKARSNALLVDREHFSLMADHESDAMAWAKEIRADSDGLWTRWEFTPPGQKLWADKILISRSPVMDLEPLGNNRFRPVAIISIAMTNTPQFETLSTFAAARAAETQPNKKDQNMNDLLTELGLDPETATEADAIAAVQALKASAAKAEAEAETAIAEAETAIAEADDHRADAFIAANKSRITDIEKFKKSYLLNPAAIEAAFGYYRAAPGQKPRINARDASTPAHAPGSGKPRAQIAAKRQSAVSTYRAGNPSCSFAAAWAACRSADPDLFADE